MATWSDISLETAACLLIAVIAYKLYRMRLSAESECCGGAVNVKASNPGNRTPTFLKTYFPGEEKQEEGNEGISLEYIEAGNIPKSKLVRTTNKEAIHETQTL